MYLPVLLDLLTTATDTLGALITDRSAMALPNRSKTRLRPFGACLFSSQYGSAVSGVNCFSSPGRALAAAPVSG